ncbi:MAG: response regulator, partial [Pseudomonadota bacterium]
ILVVEDEDRDANRIQATLRLMVGYASIEVRIAKTISTAVDAVLERTPELILLDDALKPSDTATDTIPFLKRAGYMGPIVVISGQVTRRRRTELMAAGANDVIHKDDVESVKIRECLARVFADHPVPDTKDGPKSKT